VGFLLTPTTANLPRNLAVKHFENWLRFDRIIDLSLWPFLTHPLYSRVFFFVDVKQKRSFVVNHTLNYCLASL